MSERVCSPVLVGRPEQMAALEDALRSVRQGGPATVLLGGEAGVGKSRLVCEFGVAARSAGARVLTGGCLQLGADGLPYAPFTAMLRDLVHELGAEQVAGLVPGRAIRELARLLPELGMPDPDGDPGTARARLFGEMLNLLERLAASTPVVLVIEDAHWADRSSRDLLTFLIGSQRAIKGLLVVVTFRSDELHRTHPLRPLLVTLDRIAWVDRIEVPRLGLRDSAELAASILCRQPPSDLADALFRRSEGNPLFIEALLGCDGELTCELPETLRDLLLDSVHRLPDQTQDVLRAASASGGATGPELLAVVTGLDEDSLIRALRPAVAANVLQAGPGGYVFRHELIREAVHDDLLPGEHGRLHSRFAEAIGADNSLVPPGRAAVEMAHHWSAAHDSAQALISAWRAAAQAGRSVAPAERLKLLARVLELWDQVPDAAERIGTGQVQVLEAAALAAHDADEFERGVALTTSALRQIDPVTEPVLAAQLLLARGSYKQHAGRADFHPDFEDALALVPVGLDAAVRVKILLSMAQYLHCLTDEPAYAREALAIARQTGDLASQASALLVLAMHLANAGQHAGPGSEPFTMTERAKELARDNDDDGILLRAAIYESHLLEGAGEHELAFAAARDGIVTGEDERLSRNSGSLLSINQVEPLLALGRWDEATAIAGDALAVYFAPQAALRAVLRIMSGTISLYRGDLDGAQAAQDGAFDLLRTAQCKEQEQLPMWRLRVLIRLAAAGPGAALEVAAQALDAWDLAICMPRYAWPVVTATAASAVAAARQAHAARDTRLRDQAAAILGRLRTIAEKLPADGGILRAERLTFAAAEATVATLLAGSPGDLASLAAAWDLAAGAREALGEPFGTAEALLEAAEAGLAGGDRDGAAERLRRARQIAAELGAVPLGDQIAALARRARIWLGDGQPDSGVRPGGTIGLTDREVEVLRLVAAGRSNREIGAALFISPKTASVHVSNILGKLSAGSRTEAAAKAHALRLLG